MPSEYNDQARYNLAWSHLKLGETSKAILQFDKVLSHTNDQELQSKALCHLGDIYYDNEHLSKAQEFYDQVLRDFSQSSYADYAQYRVADAFSKLGKTDAAILAYQSLDIHYPESEYRDQALYGLGMAYLVKEDYKKALEAFASLNDSFPQSAFKTRSIFQQGLAFYNLNQFEKALPIFEEIESKDFGADLMIFAMYQSGLCYLKLNQEEKALEKFKSLLGLFGSHQKAADVYYLLAEYHYDKREYVDARVYYDELVTRFGDHDMAENALYRSAYTYQWDGQLDLAAEKYWEVLAKYPEVRLLWMR